MTDMTPPTRIDLADMMLLSDAADQIALCVQFYVDQPAEQQRLRAMYLRIKELVERAAADPRTQPLDYEQVKRFFAEKLASDFAGQGRVESAFYHTIKYVYERAQGVR
ncbi:MAG: hypothetical protein MUE59_03785 [Thiobacillaceae bacterium]|jgi:hypothetical protein|nr:hypothetical protein [Thiobacillaceae bacterium]